MKPWIVEWACWAMAIIAAVIAGAELLVGSRGFVSAQAQVPTIPAVSTYDAEQLEKAADSVSSHDPFRLDRRPSTAILSSPLLPTGGTTASPPQPTPTSQLAVTGVTGGPPWRAIITGISGHPDGLVVTVGDTVEGMTIRAIRRDTVIARTAEGSLTITLKR